MPEIALSSPAIDHGLGEWPAVNIEKQRIALGRVEARRLHDPPVELHPFTDIYFEEFDRTTFDSVELGFLGSVINKRSCDFVLREAHNFKLRRISEGRISVEGPLVIGSDAVRVSSRLTLGTDQFRLGLILGE